MFDIHSPNLPESLSVPFGFMEDAFRRLTNLVKDLSPEALAFTGPAGNVNSTAMLIRHLAYADLGYLHILMGKEIPAPLEEEYGPFETDQGTLPPVSGMPVQVLLERYRRVLDMTREYLQTLTEEDATREVKVPWWGQPATLRFVLGHLASHSMFHQGQISRLLAWYMQA